MRYSSRTWGRGRWHGRLRQRAQAAGRQPDSGGSAMPPPTAASAVSILLAACVGLLYPAFLQPTSAQPARRTCPPLRPRPNCRPSTKPQSKSTRMGRSSSIVPLTYCGQAGAGQGPINACVGEAADKQRGAGALQNTQPPWPRLQYPQRPLPPLPSPPGQYHSPPAPLALTQSSVSSRV